MKARYSSIRTILCSVVVAAATAIASATTVDYWGVISRSDAVGYRIGDPWHLTLVLPDPLSIKPSLSSPPHLLSYVPSSISMTIAGVTDVNPGSYDFLTCDVGAPGTGGVPDDWGNSFIGMALDPDGGVLWDVFVSLLSGREVTSPDGLPLPSIPMDQFGSTEMEFSAHSSGWEVFGIVTGYSVTRASVPDASSTIALFGLGLFAVALLRRRRAC